MLLSVFNNRIEESPVAIIATASSKSSSLKPKPVSILSTATAAPLLGRIIVYKATRENIATMVFIAPTDMRNSLVSRFLVICCVRTVACAAPRPGKTPRIEPEKRPFIIPENARVLGIGLIVVFCLGIFVFIFRLISKWLIPNKPVNIGNRIKDEGIIKEFSMMRPRIPLSVNIITAYSFLIPRSEIIITAATAANMKWM